MAGMAAQGRWRQRRPALLVRRHGVALGERGTGIRPPFEGSAVLLRGCCAPTVREWVAQCHGADLGLTAQCRTVAGMASPGGLAEQRRDMIPRRVRGTVVRGFVSDRVPAGVRALMPRSGEQLRGRRARGSLERGGDSPEGVSSPRARRTSPEGASSPRARRGFIRAAMGPSSEAEFRSRAARPTALVGR
jgi:hypothetical protein